MQGRVKGEYFSYLLDNLNNKISGWMKNLLSMAGRVTLIRSVLSSMSNHVISVLPIPKKILKGMESILANFLWNQGSDKKHHWVRFELICRPKSDGGLGIRSLQDNMKALHGKLAWNFLNQESLWSKYANSRFKIGKRGSPIWNCISRHINSIRMRAYWEVGDGTKEVGKFLWLYGSDCGAHMAKQPIKDVLKHRANRIKFLNKIPEEIRRYYAESSCDNESNRLIWIDKSSGIFSSKRLPKNVQYKSTEGRMG